MLRQLTVKDFAIMDEIVLNFASGFNVITGETGAGKSILIDAMDFALGGRTDTSAIRSGADKANVILEFDIPPFLRQEVHNLLAEAEIDFDGNSLTLYRELRGNGRTVSRINDSMCKLAIYSEIGSLLVDIHGQTEHLSLLNPKNHLNLLDRYGDLEELRDAVNEMVRKLNDVRRTMNSLRTSEREREQRIDMLNFQISEIEAARLVEGEEADLREERTQLGNSEKLAKLGEVAYNALYSEDSIGSHSAIDALNQAAVALGKLIAVDDSMSDDHELAESLVVQAEELAQNLRRYIDDLEISPHRLEEVEERLEVINRLKRKYGDSIVKILEHAQKARQELEDIDLGEERLAELEKDEDRLLRSIGELSKTLSDGRLRAGERLANQIVEQLSHLRMDGTRFEVTITQEEDPGGCYVGDERLAFDTSGIDKVEFFMSANPGEPLRPVAKIASGGEAARIMLSLKTVLSNADRTPTLIFDEVDQGIGGRVGGVVGEKLWGLSGKHQAFCVTHMAQIAGFADTHFRVTKTIKNRRTITTVEKLEAEHRIQEMAAMLGSTSETAQQNAQELFDEATRVKRGELSLVIEQPRLI